LNDVLDDKESLSWRVLPSSVGMGSVDGGRW